MFYNDNGCENSEAILEFQYEGFVNKNQKNILISGGMDKYIMVWPLRTGRRKIKVPVTFAPTLVLKSLKGKETLLQMSPKNINMISLEKEKTSVSYTSSSRKLLNMSLLSEDFPNNFIALGDDGLVSMFDTRVRKPVFENRITTKLFDFDIDGNILYTLDNRNEIVLFDLTTRSSLEKIDIIKEAASSEVVLFNDDVYDERYSSPEEVFIISNYNYPGTRKERWRRSLFERCSTLRGESKSLDVCSFKINKGISGTQDNSESRKLSLFLSTLKGSLFQLDINYENENNIINDGNKGNNGNGENEGNEEDERNGNTIEQIFYQYEYGCLISFFKFLNYGENYWRAVLGNSDNDLYFLEKSGNTRRINRSVGHENWAWDYVEDCEKGVGYSCSTDSSINIWDIETGTIKGFMKGHDKPVYSLCFDNF